MVTPENADEEARRSVEGKVFPDDYPPEIVLEILVSLKTKYPAYFGDPK